MELIDALLGLVTLLWGAIDFMVHAGPLWWLGAALLTLGILVVAFFRKLTQ